MVDQALPSLADLAPAHATQRPGAVLQLRPAFCKHQVGASYMVPGQPSRSDAVTHWIPQSGRARVRTASSVKYFIDGRASYAAMREALATVTSSSHFVLLLCWSLDLDFSLTGRPGGDTFRNLLLGLRSTGAKVRILYSNHTTGGLTTSYGRQQSSVPDQINGLETGQRSQLNQSAFQYRCALDSAVRSAGCHHQKVMVVQGSQGLMAFFGGVDIWRDRVFADAGGGPQHDVHARVLGPAADDLLELFRTRWRGAPSQLMTRDDLSWIRATPATAPAPQRSVRVIQTIGNPNIQGSSDTYPHLQHAVRQSRRFIYLQDQYFWSEEMAQELHEAARRVSHHITILVPRISLSSPEAYNLHQRRRCFRILLTGRNQQNPDSNGSTPLPARDRHKIGVFVLTGAHNSYVHSKIWVFDDECAEIGSANCNDRGYHHDSEAGAVTVDHALRWHHFDLSFARKLRTELWIKHLNLNASERHLAYDGAAGIQLWRQRPGGSHITPYRDRFGAWWDFARYQRGSDFPGDLIADPR